MDASLISEYDYLVRGFDCGYGGGLRPFAMANFLQEAAGDNAARHGFGMEDLQAKGWTWMLSRLDLRVDALPRAGDSVRVRTWPGGARRLFAFRDIEMLASDGRSLVRAVYAYLVVDMSARRPLRPESVFGPGETPVGAPDPVPDYSFEIPASSGSEPEFAQRVSGRHIDNNGHANNAHLVNWLVDAAAEAADTDTGAPAALASLKVEFLAEALRGDELAARGAPGPGGSFVAELLRGGTMVARALVSFYPGGVAAPGPGEVS